MSGMTVANSYEVLVWVKPVFPPVKALKEGHRYPTITKFLGRGELTIKLDICSHPLKEETTMSEKRLLLWKVGMRKGFSIKRQMVYARGDGQYMENVTKIRKTRKSFSSRIVLSSLLAECYLTVYFFLQHRLTFKHRVW